jgi:hypothetical protein
LFAFLLCAAHDRYEENVDETEVESEIEEEEEEEEEDDDLSEIVDDSMLV